MVAEVCAEVETPVAFVPHELPAAAADIRLPSSILQDIRLPTALDYVEPSSENFVNVSAGTIFSPTSSISAISDLTPTELREEIEHSKGQTTIRHDTFYFEDGNVEVV